jgi:hypothetical protein
MAAVVPFAALARFSSTARRDAPCVVATGDVVGKKITTIEGLANEAC